MSSKIKKVAVIALLAVLFALAGPVVMNVAMDAEEAVVSAAYPGRGDAPVAGSAPGTGSGAGAPTASSGAPGSAPGTGSGASAPTGSSGATGSAPGTGSGAAAKPIN